MGLQERTSAKGMQLMGQMIRKPQSLVFLQDFLLALEASVAGATGTTPALLLLIQDLPESFPKRVSDLMVDCQPFKDFVRRGLLATSGRGRGDKSTAFSRAEQLLVRKLLLDAFARVVMHQSWLAVMAPLFQVLGEHTQLA